MSEPKVSVIIPVYNVEKYLRECVDSVLGQTLRDIEVILVDDKSTDSSPAICDAYAATDSRVKVIHSKVNQGCGLSRNVGLEIAKGKYVSFMDADDFVDSEFLEKGSDWMDRYGLDAIRFGYDRFMESSDVAGTNPWHSVGELEILCKGPELRAAALTVIADHPNPKHKNLGFGARSWAAIYSRSMFSEKGQRFFSEREYLSEDVLFLYHFTLAASKIGFSDATPYHYRVNPNSITTRPQLDFPERTEKFCRHMEMLMDRDGYGKEGLLHTMAYAMVVLRAKCKSIFRTPSMTLAQKKDWLKEKCKNSYYQRIYREFDVSMLPFKHRLSIRLFAKGRFMPLYSFVVGQELIRDYIRKFRK